MHSEHDTDPSDAEANGHSPKGVPKLGGSPNKPFDIVAFVLRRKKLIPVLGLLVFMVLSPLALVGSRSYYEAGGRMLLAREIPQIISAKDDVNLANYFHDYAGTMVMRIKSPYILEEAVSGLPPKLRTSFFKSDVPPNVGASILERNLEVAHLPNTHIISIKLTASRPDGLADMVNAVMHTFMEKVQSEEESKNKRRLEYLRQEKASIENIVANQLKSLGEIINTTKTSSLSDTNNVTLNKYVLLQNDYIRAYNERIRAENEYNGTIKEAEEIRRIPIQVLADELVAGDQALWRTSSWTYEKLQELRGSIDGIARNNPDRKYIEARMEAMKTYETKLRKEITERAERLVREKRDYELKKKVVTAEAKYHTAEKTEKDIMAELELTKKELEQNSVKMLAGTELRTTLENNKQKLFQLDARIRDLSVESKAPLRISIDTPAVTPASTAGSNSRKLLTLFFLISFTGVTGVFLVNDIRDGRIKSPREVESAIGFPSTWPISNYLPQTPGKDFSMAVIDDPESLTAKAVRSLAVRLNKEREKYSAKTALVSSVSEGGGATGISLNLAAAMARMCPKVLLIDVNISNPAIGKLLEIPEGCPQIQDLLRNKALVGENLYFDQARNIHVLPLTKPDEWFRSDTLTLPETIRLLGEKYDFIILDSAPILKSDLTEQLTINADVSVLVIQGEKTLYGDLRRSAEIFVRLETPSLAAVLNWGGPKDTPQIQVWARAKIEALKHPLVRKYTLILFEWMIK